MFTDLSVGTLTNKVMFCGHVAHGECWANATFLKNIYTHPDYALALYGKNLHLFYNNMNDGLISTVAQSLVGFYISNRKPVHLTSEEIELNIERLLVGYEAMPNLVAAAWEKEHSGDELTDFSIWFL